MILIHILIVDYCKKTGSPRGVPVFYGKNQKRLDIFSQTGRYVIVINVENNEKPVILLNSSVIDFTHLIKAEFDFDLDIYS